MKCIGCGTDVKNTPAAYAIMSKSDLGALKVQPAVKGPGSFHAAPVCEKCFKDPANRKRKIKAHFSMPGDVKRMLGVAGSSSIGG